MAFNPNDYLGVSEKESTKETKSSFDPDSYLSSTASTPSSGPKESLSTVPLNVAGTVGNYVRNNVGPVIPEGMPGQIGSKIADVAGKITPQGIVRSAIDVGLMSQGHAPWGTILKNIMPDAKSALTQPISETIAPYVNAAKALPGQAATAGKEALGMIGRGIVRGAGPIAAINESLNAYNQAQEGDYTGAGISGAKAASMMPQSGMFGATALPGLEFMGGANTNFRQQNPLQQQESAMSALSGTAPGQAGEYTSASQPGIDQNYIDQLIRRKAAERVLRPIAPGQ